MVGSEFGELWGAVYGFWAGKWRAWERQGLGEINQDVVCGHSQMGEADLSGCSDTSWLLWSWKNRKVAREGGERVTGGNGMVLVSKPGINTGVGCHALLLGIFPTQGSKPGFPHCKRIWQPTPVPWKIPWTEEPGRLQPMGSQRVGHDRATSLHFFTFCVSH